MLPSGYFQCLAIILQMPSVSTIHSKIINVILYFMSHDSHFYELRMAASSLLANIDTQHEDQIHDCQFDFYGTRLATASRLTQGIGLSI